MRFLIIGAGGVGGYFGGLLHRVHDVVLVARGEHLQAIRSGGLQIRSSLGDVHVDAMATDNPRGLPAPDCILICVKLWQLEDAIELARACAGPNTTIIPLQNGVRAVDKLIQGLGAERVLGGTCHIASEIEAPGIIRHTGKIARITIGELDGRQSARLDELIAAFAAAGVDALASAQVQRAIWEKFILLSTFSGVTASYRSPIGPLRSAPDIRSKITGAIAETATIARRIGIPITDDCEKRTLEFIDTLPAEMKSSMLVDLEHGRNLEWPWLSGEVVNLGATLKVPTPVHAEFADALRRSTAK